MNEEDGSIEVCAVITDVERIEVDIHILLISNPGDKAGKTYVYVAIAYWL